MGRKRTGISGLSHFAADVFDAPEPPVTTTQTASIGRVSQDNQTSGRLTRLASERADDLSHSDSQPKKKRKTGLLGPSWEKYDATDLVPFYTQPAHVPAHLQKYFSQRERYFSIYSSGCLLDEEGWYSVTPERVADQIAERCRCNVILDAFCGVGGNAIAFARTCEKVIALDTSPVRLALARHNAVLYGVADRIEFVLADFLSFARRLAELQESHPTPAEPDPERSNTASKSSASAISRKFDVVFLSPPWGGPSYLTDRNDVENVTSETSEETPAAPEYSLASIQPIHGRQLFQLARRLTPNVAYYLPRNSNLDEIASLVNTDRDVHEVEGECLEQQEKDGRVSPQTSGTKGKAKNKQQKLEMVEVEEEWMGSKLKALTCYFGGLVAGQEDKFYA